MIIAIHNQCDGKLVDLTWYTIHSLCMLDLTTLHFIQTVIDPSLSYRRSSTSNNWSCTIATNSLFSLLSSFRFQQSYSTSFLNVFISHAYVSISSTTVLISSFSMVAHSCLSEDPSSLAKPNFFLSSTPSACSSCNFF